MGRITIRVQPGASRRGIVGRVGEEWKVAVPEPPADGKANEAVASFLADLCGVRRAEVALLQGASARRKTFEVGGLTAGAIDERFEAEFSR